jgi:hypothetical protein
VLDELAHLGAEAVGIRVRGDGAQDRRDLAHTEVRIADERLDRVAVECAARPSPSSRLGRENRKVAGRRLAIGGLDVGVVPAADEVLDRLLELIVAETGRPRLANRLVVDVAMDRRQRCAAPRLGLAVGSFHSGLVGRGWRREGRRFGPFVSLCLVGAAAWPHLDGLTRGWARELVQQRLGALPPNDPNGYGIGMLFVAVASATDAILELDPTPLLDDMSGLVRRRVQVW